MAIYKTVRGVLIDLPGDRAAAYPAKLVKHESAPKKSQPADKSSKK